MKKLITLALTVTVTVAFAFASTASADAAPPVPTRTVQPAPLAIGTGKLAAPAKLKKLAQKNQQLRKRLAKRPNGKPKARNFGVDITANGALVVTGVGGGPEVAEPMGCSNWLWAGYWYYYCDTYVVWTGIGTYVQRDFYYYNGHPNRGSFWARLAYSYATGEWSEVNLRGYGY